MMKKLVVFMLTMVMVFSLTACGGSGDQSDSGSDGGSGSGTESDADSGSDASDGSDLEYVKDKGTLVVGITDLDRKSVV